jgi:lipopolysaccharide transport system permease protein
MQNYSSSPREIIASLWRNRQLLKALIKREGIGRYRGSVMGMTLSFFNAIVMPAIYTFVFSVIFKARWSAGSDSKTEFALVLFAGLLVFNLFAECINRAPGLILANVNYVKKVVFPLEILPWVSLGAALFHMLISFGVWLLFYLLFFGAPHVTLLLFPLILLPLVLMIMGLSWILASLGVFLRDVGQLIGLAVTVLMFLTPIFYPLSAIPEKYRLFIYLNPMTIVVEQTRGALIWGQPLHLGQYGAYFLVSAVLAAAGFAWFQKTRKGFADVL